MPSPFYGVMLDRIVQHALPQRKVMKNELHAGDIVILRTERSEYRLRLLESGCVEASGGWFEKKGSGRSVLRVSGATWGGSAIMPGVFAACGLRVEFSNRLITSPVQRILVWTASSCN